MTTTKTPKAAPTGGEIRLSRADAEWLIRGALAAAAKDDVTPVLCAVHWTIADGRVTVTATDRYRVHQLYVQIDDTSIEGDFLMDVRLAKRLIASWHTPRSAYRDQLVILRWTAAEPLPTGHTGRIPRLNRGTIKFEILADAQDPESDRISLESTQVNGTFPPVTKLFGDADEQADGEALRDIALNTHFIAATKWLNHQTDAPMRFTMPRADGGKPRPIVITNIAGTARALIQPHLFYNKTPYGAAPVVTPGAKSDAA